MGCGVPASLASSSAPAGLIGCNTDEVRTWAAPCRLVGQQHLGSWAAAAIGCCNAVGSSCEEGTYWGTVGTVASCQAEPCSLLASQSNSTAVLACTLDPFVRGSPCFHQVALSSCPSGQQREAQSGACPSEGWAAAAWAPLPRRGWAGSPRSGSRGCWAGPGSSRAAAARTARPETSPPAAAAAAAAAALDSCLQTDARMNSAIVWGVRVWAERL